MAKIPDKRTEKDIPRSSLGEWVGRCFPACFLLLFLALLFIQMGDFSGDHYRHPRDADCISYVQNSQKLFSATVNPFAFRILTPLLVKKLMNPRGQGAIGYDFAWNSFTFLCVYGSGMLFYLFCRRVLKLSSSASFIAVLMLVSNWIYSLFQFELPFFVDPLNNLLWILALYFLFIERWDWFYVVLGVGMFNKEVILLLGPLCPLFAYLKSGRICSRTVFLNTAAVVGLLGLYAAYRYYVGSALNLSHFQLASAYNEGTKGTILFAITQQKDLWNIFLALQFPWFFFALAIYELQKAYGWQNRYLLASLYLLAACFMGRLFAADANRVFVMMAPLVIGLSVSYWCAGFKTKTFPSLVFLFFLYLCLNVGWISNKEPMIWMNILACVYGLWRVRGLSSEQMPS